MKTLKHLSVLLAVLLVVTLAVVGFAVSAEEATVITVTDEASFNAAMDAANASANIVLANDITLTNGNTTMNTDFKGTFDGQGYTINGITNTLFKVVSGGTVKNVTLNGAIDYVNNKPVFDAKKAATVASEAINSAVLEDITSNVNIESVTSSDFNAGGIIGYAKVATFTNCTYAGSYTATGKGQVGGIVGYVNNGTSGTNTYTNCVFSGTITVNGDGSDAMDIGGIIGRTVNGTNKVVTCSNTGKIVVNKKGTHNLGGVVGYFKNNKGSITGATVTGTADIAEGVNATMKPLVGKYDDFVLIDGTYVVSTGTGLKTVFGKLTASDNVTLDADVTIPDGGMPTANVTYTGTFDGQNHTINGITNTMFNAISGGTVKNVTINGAISYRYENNTETDTATKDVARKAATITFSASNSAVFENIVSNVDITTTSENFNAGGIVGYANAATFTNCTYAGSYTASATTGGQVGGVIGYVNATGNVYTNCSFTGTITVNGDTSNNMDIGGILGYATGNTNTVVGGTNTGTIVVNKPGAHNFGGIVGRFNNASSSVTGAIAAGTAVIAEGVNTTMKPFLGAGNCTATGAVLVDG
ncbi:MAG: hypothetical protein IJD35_01860, partial [Clostridia bacterium]|nr:hypothetical protein [Clostridia bacterium]